MILYLTLFPRPLGENEIELFEGADKVVHAIMFGAMTFTLALDRHKARGSVTRPALIIITIITIATGILIEFLQHIMELGRSADVADAVADTIGALAAALIFRHIPFTSTP